MTQGIKYYQDNIAENYYCVGPLNINKKLKRAIMPSGAELELDDNEFAALDMLAAHEGQPLAFETIYTAIWQKEDSECVRFTARQALGELMTQVRMIGDGFIWIEYSLENGYTFRTEWGLKWWVDRDKA